MSLLSRLRLLEHADDALRVELRTQAEDQFKTLNEAADAFGCPRIHMEMGSRQFALAAAFIAYVVAVRAGVKEPSDQ